MSSKTLALKCAFLASLAAVGSPHLAAARDSLHIYKDNKYEGYIAPNPYSGRCCDIYDERGNLKGTIRDPLVPSDRDSRRNPYLPPPGRMERKFR